jgi:hypothetical protein
MIMSKHSILVFAGSIVIVGVMVYSYEFQHVGVKGLGKKTPVAIVQKKPAVSQGDNIDQTDSDANASNQADTTTRKLSKTANNTPQKPQVSKEKFVAFSTWPTASNNCPNEPNEANLQQQSANTEQIASGTSTPQSVLDDELKSTSQLYQGLANQLDKQNINVTEYNIRLRILQREYNEKIKNLFQKKQKLDATQKLIDNGAVTTEEGSKIMWQLVLPNETIRAISAKAKAPVKQPAAAKPVYGTVTGITYSNEAPLVMIDGEIYGEGASIHGVRIAKIYQQSVDFEYKGFTWNQGVNDQPSPNWP